MTAVTDTREYDGGVLSSGTPNITSGNLVGSDTQHFRQRFSDRNAGTGKTLIPTGSVLDNNGGANYLVTFVNDTTGVITPRAITVTAATDSKKYDGGITSTGVPTLTVGSLAPDDTATWTQTFDNKNVGNGNKTLTPTGTVSDGNSGNNYTVTFAPVHNGTITTRPITVTAVTDSKVYDGGVLSDKTPAITGDGLAVGDTAKFRQRFDTKDVGNGTKTLIPTGSVVDGNNGNNYAVTFVNYTGGTITPAPLSITANNKSNVYGYSPLPTLDATYFGFVASEGPGDLAGGLLCTTTAVVLSPAPGPYPITCSGQTSTNYDITYKPGQLTVTQASTTTGVTSSLNPSTFGMMVTFTATVSPQYTGVPTGIVTFKDGATTLGTGTLNGSGVATFATSALTVAAHTIYAVYAGDVNFVTSTGSMIQNVQPYNFIGFLPPIDNLPIVNSSKGGQTIPVKWQLKDVNGNLISDLGTLAANGLVSGQIACDSSSLVLPVEETLSSPGSTVFRFDGMEFIFNWQTAKGWSGSCRLLQVTLSDGTQHFAKFTLK